MFPPLRKQNDTKTVILIITIIMTWSNEGNEKVKPNFFLDLWFLFKVNITCVICQNQRCV